MNFRRGRPRDEPEINLIPMIDVFLVVLIFLATSTTFSTPTTRTGVDESARLPLPSCPSEFLPQHCTVLFAVMAQLWLLPSAIFLTPDVSPATCTGMRDDAFVPLPSWPN